MKHKMHICVAQMGNMENTFSLNHEQWIISGGDKTSLLGCHPKITSILYHHTLNIY